MARDEERGYWTAEIPSQLYPPLPGRTRCQVAVIGGGIVGLTVAERLKRAGRHVVVVDNGRVGAQVTGRSTAKVTALHGLVYDALIQMHGLEAAQAYADANRAAMNYIEERTREDGIDCDLTPAVAYTISEWGVNREAIEREVAAALKVGLPVEQVSEATSPVTFDSGVKLSGQFQFQPYRYATGLAGTIDGEGGAVHENTRAYSVHVGAPHEVMTDHGMVIADQVVIATNMPFMDRGLFFAKASPRQHVVLAARLPEGVLIDGMFLNVDKPGYSFRRYESAQGPVLILTGPGSRPGHHPPAARLAELKRLAVDKFGASEVLGWWFNEDYDSVDRLPYVGPLTPVTPEILVATGFSAWGLTNGTAAAQMLARHILSEADVTKTPFSANRWNLRHSAKRLLNVNLHVGMAFVDDRRKAFGAKEAKHLGIGEGGICRRYGRAVAAYRDEEGTLHVMSPRCPHLKCFVAWNPKARTWECPCHGSVFSAEGRMLHGPAVRDMKRLD